VGEFRAAGIRGWERRGRLRCQRQSNHEFAAFAKPVAKGLDPPVMHLDEAPSQAQTDPDAAA